MPSQDVSLLLQLTNEETVNREFYCVYFVQLFGDISGNILVNCNQNLFNFVLFLFFNKIVTTKPKLVQTGEHFFLPSWYKIRNCLCLYIIHESKIRLTS